MPDSQENNWAEAGVDAQIRFIQDGANWDQVIERFQRITDSFRGIGPVAGEAFRSLEQLTPLIEEPMISLKQAGYPRWDSYNTYWFDAYGIYDFDGGVCFVCNKPTARMDILLNKHFCNSTECNTSLTNS